MSGGEIPILVCVSSDVAVRQRVVQRLDDVGPVVVCADLAQLRAMFPAPAVEAAIPGGDAGEGPAGRPADRAANWGDLVVDRAGHLVTWRGAPLGLTRTERELLARLVSPPIGLWSYERLFASVWGGAYLGDTAILHSAVKRLRRKLRVLPDGPQVQTVRGVGYRLATPPETVEGHRDGPGPPQRADGQG
ncbi:winged helix-turn-helix domain-containing protein [Micromonospora sp. CA-263727]|uniref:winged helix-turn-helix domain-containing protein n=1 Tax=Micromonospora sp. CA-263727 TaxID=3239967 RepID=UPI003D93DA7A